MLDELVINNTPVKASENTITTLKNLKLILWKLQDLENYFGDSANSKNRAMNKYIYFFEEVETIKNAIKYIEDDLLDKNPQVTL